MEKIIEYSKIDDGNKLIAEFMHGTFTSEDHFGNGNIINYVSFEPKFNPNFQIKNAGRKFQVIDLRYHLSWDWLMPVIEKIRDHSYTSVIQSNIGHSNEVKIYIGIENKPILINEWNNKIPMIDCVWMAVVQFINFYNERGK